MATNFPSSADSFTNPSPSDDMATVSHSSQHTNVNDAVEAIETALLDGAPLHIDDANERVGVGTTSPVEELHVEGDVFMPDGGNLWIGNNADSGGRVRLHHSTNGTAYLDYYDSLYFRSGASSSSNTVTFSSSGTVTMPSQPSFYAYQSGTGQSAGGSSPVKVSFNTIQHNVGSHYSSSNDRFTCPIDGRYLIHWYGLGSATNSVSRYYLYINGALWNDLHIRGDGVFPGYTRVATLDLNANDYLEVYYKNDSSAAQYTSAGNSYYTFSATLLG